MEDIELEQNKCKQAKVELIYYINDDEEKKGNLEFTYDKEIEIISFTDIIASFYSFLKKNKQYIIDNYNEQYFDINQDNIIYESIRYFDGDGWITLKESEFILIDEELTLNNLKIMIYCDIISPKEVNIKNNYGKIDKELSYVYKQINKEKNNYDLPSDAPLNLVVLTANPLMDGEKELRIMNEFNIIASNIYKSFEEEDYLKYTEFLPLTLNTLNYFITNEQKRPVILHLICKSTYIIPEEEKEQKGEKDNSEDYTNLIFEDDNNYYNLKFIDKKILEKEIFNFEHNKKLKENVNKIILIISTPLSKDVYNIFKNFGFKNIIIQHTTLADVNFIADFNYTFYKDIITHLNQPIKDIYEDALNCDRDGANPPTFCCCFHKHKTTCDFFKNLKNELYNNKNVEKLENFKIIAPHFNHLFPDCYNDLPKCHQIINALKDKPECKEFKLPTNSFCFHTYNCLTSYFYFFPRFNKKDKIVVKIPDEPKQTFANFCCCKEDPQIHNISSVFITDLSLENNKNEIRFRNAELIREKEGYTPNYEKMISFIGNNEIIYDAIKFFSSADMNLNIYGDKLENLKKFGDAIIEYYLERYYLLKFDESSMNINRNKSAENYNNNLEESNSNDSIKIDNIELYSIKSSPIIRKINKIDFVIIYLNNDYIDTLHEEEKINNNTIYFIYVCDADLKDKIKNKFNKKVWFSKEEDKNIQKRIKFEKEPVLKYYKDYLYKKVANPNEYIKLQNKKIVRNYWRRVQE